MLLHRGFWIVAGAWGLGLSTELRGHRGLGGFGFRVLVEYGPCVGTFFFAGSEYLGQKNISPMFTVAEFFWAFNFGSWTLRN